MLREKEKLEVRGNSTVSFPLHDRLQEEKSRENNRDCSERNKSHESQGLEGQVDKAFHLKETGRRERKFLSTSEIRAVGKKNPQLLFSFHYKFSKEGKKKINVGIGVEKAPLVSGA